MKHFRVYWQTCVLLLLATVVGATTIVMPTDEQLIAKSPLIIEGSVVSTGPVMRGDTIWTESIIAVDRTLKGSAAARVTIREIGGISGDRITKIFGAPEYVAGERVLAFLTPTPRGDYQTMDLFVGKFSEAKMADGRNVWLRHDDGADATLLDGDLQPIHARNVQRVADGFSQYVVDRAAGRNGDASYGVENPVLQRDLQPANRGGAQFSVGENFTLISEPQVYRWFAFDEGRTANWYSLGSQPGYTNGGVSEVQTAMASWTGYSQAKIRYSYAGAHTGTSPGLNATNGVNEVLFNDPNQEIAGSWNPSTGGVVGLGGFNGVAAGGNWVAPFAGDASHPQQSYRAYDITEGNLTVQDGVSPTARISSQTLSEILAHELGHTLGFGHSADSSALMYYSVTGLGPALRPDDQLAARWLYPNGAQTGGGTPTAPNAPSGLTATVTGTNVALQWNDNATDETGQGLYVAVGNGAFSKVGDAAASARSATLTGFTAGTYRIYVTAYNAAGESAASNIVSVTIQPTQVSAAFSASPATGIAGQTSFIFTDQSTGSITSRQWNFGDGTTSTVTSPSHVYAAAGTYTITLTVSGSANTSQTSRSVSVTAPVQAVVASFNVTPSAPTAGQNVIFTDASTGPVTAWSWAFGDGLASTLQNPVKQYAQAGTYRVTLTVFGSGGGSSSTSKTVVVSAPIPATPPVSVAFDFGPVAPTAGDVVQFSDHTSGQPSSWNWSFGDGTSSTAQNPTHVFTAPGSYTVTLTSSNSVSSQSASRAITVAAQIVAFRSLVSAAAQTNGVGGTVWRTELTLFNAGSEAANVNLIYIPGAGGALQTRGLFLGAHQSITYNNTLNDVFGLASGSGAVAIEATSPTTSANLRVASRTFTTGATGTYGQAVPDVRSADLPQTVYLTGLEADGDYRTNVGLVNRSSAPVAATLALFNAAGASLGTATVTVPANNFQQTLLTVMFPNAGTLPQAAMSMRVTSAAADAISVYASVVDNRSQDPIYIRGMAAPSGSDLTLPAVGRAPGANATFWRSDVTLYNPSSASTTVTLRYLAANSDDRNPAVKTLSLPAGRTIVLADLLQSQFGVASGSGALNVSWSGSGPIVGSRTYTTASAGGTYGQSIDPIGAFGSEVFVTGLRSDGSFRSNVGFVNGSDATIGVNVALLSAYGQTIATSFVALAPRSQTQTSVGALFPGIDASSLGTFTLSATSGNGPTLFAYGSVVDNASGDPVFFAGK